LVVPYPNNVIDVTAKTLATISTEYTEKIAWFNTVKFIGINNNWNTMFTLNIPAEKTVDWEASISGSVGNNPLINLNGGTGTFNVKSGGIISSGSSSVALNIMTAYTVNISGGTITGNATNDTGTIYNQSAATINVSGGTVSSSSSTAAIRNSSAGIITVSGGTVTNTSNNVAISNTGTGTLNVLDGTVSCTGEGYAIYNYSTGGVNISGGLITSSRSTNANSGTITNIGATTINITGGIVENTAASTEPNRRAIQNSASGTVNVTGGVVKLTNPDTVPSASVITSAIRNDAGGQLTVTAPAVVIPYPGAPDPAYFGTWRCVDGPYTSVLTIGANTIRIGYAAHPNPSELGNYIEHTGRNAWTRVTVTGNPGYSSGYVLAGGSTVNNNWGGNITVLSLHDTADTLILGFGTNNIANWVFVRQ